MIREARTASGAWETLRSFFVKQNLHFRVQLRKQLHKFSMSFGANLMEHLLKFDDFCLRLSAVGTKLEEDDWWCYLEPTARIRCYDSNHRVKRRRHTARGKGNDSSRVRRHSEVREAGRCFSSWHAKSRTQAKAQRHSTPRRVEQAAKQESWVARSREQQTSVWKTSHCLP
ncbi:TPA: hypothetical protein N0F65_007482 [Lagenidium giganteum]|uniref:Retrotransposon gag domain-containing protein n=1 Tax=Lagenidium giganteum TaxID=4803 RepID=A0AAV2ZII2_9STRA|nr:TPA: hypothetical protein N0F65_007482 [Lagenidium giganteum]